MPYLKKVKMFFKLTHSQALFYIQVSDCCDLS